MDGMTEAKKKCMVCGKTVIELKGGICQPCQERIRREAMGEQAGVSNHADRELAHQGVPPVKEKP